MFSDDYNSNLPADDSQEDIGQEKADEENSQDQEM